MAFGSRVQIHYAHDLFGSILYRAPHALPVLRLLLGARVMIKLVDMYTFTLAPRIPFECRGVNAAATPPTFLPAYVTENSPWRPSHWRP